MALSKIDIENMVTGELTTTNGGTGATSFTAGITMADQWRLTTTFQGDANPIASNLERVDTTGQGYIGSAMTQSSGIFTFPSTGVYEVKFNADCYYNGNSRYITGYIYGTIDNSNYNLLSANRLFIQQTDSQSTSNSLITSTFFDVTSTSNCKVKFRAEAEDNGAYFYGNTDESSTFMTFIRLGDT